MSNQIAFLRFSNVVLIFLAVIGGLAHAQNSASIAVSVEDASGSNVPGVHVLLTNDATSAERQLSADDRGTATITLLPPGKYTFKAEKAGFKPVIVSQIILEVSDELALKMRMQVGDVQTSISVRADALLLQSESGSASLVVNERRLSDLPLNGKNFETLAALGADSSDERTPQGVASHSGAAGFATGYEGAPSVSPVEPLREIRVIGADTDATSGLARSLPRERAAVRDSCKWERGSHSEVCCFFCEETYFARLHGHREYLNESEHVVLLALLPARRASGLDPLTALRD